jgi:uncharacterized membrane protein
MKNNRVERLMVHCLMIVIALFLMSSTRAAPPMPKSKSESGTERRHSLLRHPMIAKRLDVVRKRGLPVTMKELAASYGNVPDKENGAKVLLALKPKYGALDKSFEGEFDDDDWGMLYYGDEGRGPDGKMNPKALTVFRRYIAKARPLLRAGDRVCKFKRSAYPLEFREGLGMRLTHLDFVRRMAFRYRAEALLAAEEGQAERAAESLVTILHVVGTLREDPILISQNVRVGLVNAHVKALAEVLSRIPLTDAHVMKLDDVLVKAESQDGISLGLNGDRCVALVEYVKLIEGADDALVKEQKGAGMGIAATLGKIAMDAWLTADLVFYLDMMAQWDAVVALPMRQRVKAADKFGKTLDAAVAKRGKLSVAAMLLPSIGAATTRDVQIRARLRCARVALAIERYRLKHKKLPKTLAVLAPKFIKELPADPFTGKGLMLKLGKEKGYMVYSVGQNQKDDGGEAKGRTDVVFEVAR